VGDYVLSMHSLTGSRNRKYDVKGGGDVKKSTPYQPGEYQY
jgi:hypothetical protein